MVSTRRMESSGSAADTVSRLSGNVHSGLGDNSDSCEGNSSSSESEPSQEEESWSSQCASAKQLRHGNTRDNTATTSLRVRELRNRFVCSVGLSAYSTRRRSRPQPTAVRSCRRLDECSERPAYTQKTPTHLTMPEDSDSNFLIERERTESDEIFSPQRESCRKRHLRHSSRRSMTSKRSRSGRMDRLLRPLKSQCYTDPHSSMHSNSSDNDCKQEQDLRRSTRQRKLQYDSFNTSWITDAQMVKGYPSLKMEFLSDQDSRHSQENGILEGHSHSHHNVDVSREKSNRREIKKNMKYVYDYDTPDVRTRKIRTSQSDGMENSGHNGIMNHNDTKIDEISKNKEKKTLEKYSEEENDSSRLDETIVNGDKDNEDNKEVVVEKENAREPRACVLKDELKNEEASESENDLDIRRQRKRRRSNINYMDDPRFSPRRTRGRKISESSDEDIRNQRYKYQLRQRKPKQESISMDVARRRRNRRRDNTSSDNSMSDDEHPIARKNKSTRHNRRGTVSGDSPLNDKQLKSGQSGGAPVPIGPETLDTKVRFASVGGLDNHVRCLREMVVLPMMYPEVFKQFQIQPPRGVLFHGPPGTGKTLIARALANECSFGSRKVSFFMRKGADLLSKWVGESEKQLRLLFEQAAQMKPSIIFFDELDGLAPVRSSRQDQIHASIVSTLLALMDGLDSRGEVIVIGATNRIDAIDPALRRPGRFDRELYFPLPARKEREEILKVHVSQWTTPPSPKLISHLAEQSAGYCGSDLRALCSEAVIQGLRRTYPQVYTTDHRLQLDPTQVQVEKVDFLRARSLLIPASHRVTQSLGRKLPTVLEPLLRKPLNTVLMLFKETFPHGLDPALANVKVCIQGGMQTAQLLLTGDTHAQGQSTYLAPALLFHMEHVNMFTLDLAALFKESGRTAEEACVEIFNEARRNVPSVVYVPSIEQWWSLVGETVRAIFLSQLSQLDPRIPVLLLATANVEYKQLPEQISAVFSTYRKEVLHLSPPVTGQRESFFRPLIVVASTRPPKPVKSRPKTPPPLERAQTPTPPQLTEAELQKLYEREEQVLRELRIFLRDMCKKLASNKMFYMFTKPVDLEEVPDYLSIIKQPMDLESMMTKVDLHRYSSAQEFLTDIDLICKNALEYNPAKTPADKLIRHRACALRDHAYAMIKAEMDSDFEDQCRGISRKRRERKASTSQSLPPFILTPEVGPYDLLKDSMDSPTEEKHSECNEDGLSSQKAEGASSRISPHRRRKVPMWARGYLGSRKRKRSSRTVLIESQQQDEYKSSPGMNQKSSSGDEFKENKPELSVSELSIAVDINEQISTEEPHEIKKVDKDLSIPLSVKCDQEQTSVTHKVNTESTRTKLNDTLSPAVWPTFADLIEDTPQIDEMELEDQEPNQQDQKQVNIDKAELERVLTQAVSTTRGCSVLALMDLYGQLNRVIVKYSRTHERHNLPQELQREISRFQEIQKRPPGSSRCPTPAS